MNIPWDWYKMCIYLNPSEKWWTSSDWIIIPTLGGKWQKSCLKPPTRYIYIYTYITGIKITIMIYNPIMKMIIPSKNPIYIYILYYNPIYLWYISHYNPIIMPIYGFFSHEKYGIPKRKKKWIKMTIPRKNPAGLPTLTPQPQPPNAGRWSSETSFIPELLRKLWVFIG